VADWKRPNPDHQPLHCSASWHLWQHGLALAIYDKTGAVTNNGDLDRTFWAKRTTLATFFDASYNGVCNSIKLLRHDGWLLDAKKQNHFIYVTHAKWAELHPGKCAVINLCAFQEEAQEDPFLGRLYAIAQGQVRLKEHWIAGVRRHADDETIIEMFAKEMRAAREQRAKGKDYMTSPENCFYRVSLKLKELFNAKLSASNQ
jgi:hypothetical protein